MATLAGHFSQLRFSSHSAHDFLWEDDRKNAFDFIRSLVGPTDECEAYLDFLVVRTRNLLAIDMIWRQVEAVAEALMKQKNLSGPEALAICKRVFSE